MSKAARAVTLFIIVAPLFAVAMIPFVFDKVAVDAAMAQLPVWYILTGVGITVSFHRELTHLSVRLRPAARYVMFWLGLLALEGGLDWPADHRKHHKYTDKEGDPHSPHGFGEGVGGVIRGFAHSHFAWLLSKEKTDRNRWVPDLMRDKGIVILDKFFPLWAVLTFVIPGLTTVLFVPSWQGFWAGVFWGGPVRIFLVHHVTWAINSWCHMVGTRPFKGSTIDDMSTNHWVFGFIGFGEGWHRNHHTFPRSARIGLRWWEFDLGWLTIKFLRLIGQVEWVRIPSAEEIATKRA